jgi:hypothetical protein
MYFCPKCSYSFDISKSTHNTETTDTDDRQGISKVPELIKKIEMKEDLSMLNRAVNYMVFFKEI